MNKTNNETLTSKQTQRGTKNKTNKQTNKQWRFDKQTKKKKKKKKEQMNKTNNEALTSKQTSNVAQSSQGSSYFPGSIYFDHNWGVIFATDLWFPESKFHPKFYLKIRPKEMNCKKDGCFRDQNQYQNYKPSTLFIHSLF